ncbi:Hypothetical protein Trvi_ORF15 [Trabala vishnou gigantina nucleopolyhedrovirus]|uniref:Hypothetical protein n=1 Tax=Trabala vishnou gigantina nucleopolyhedrovirus TaxID=2863583 RepID=UPI002481AEA8|nr:Hypothetical protein QKU87_gp015 [Trabala vishnou gigantina nucleopolyhedrovirus]QYC92760.1 Hypothetical protein Trvi_ORF15 [Trabala vishnou gigantina nucleopolyhedrovirus]
MQITAVNQLFDHFEPHIYIVSYDNGGRIINIHKTLDDRLIKSSGKNIVEKDDNGGNTVEEINGGENNGGDDIVNSSNISKNNVRLKYRVIGTVRGLDVIHDIFSATYCDCDQGGCEENCDHNVDHTEKFDYICI